MAGFNELQVPGYSDLIRRLLGEDAHFTSISPELTIALILELEKIDWAILRGVRIWTSSVQVSAAVAAKVSQIDCRNPATDMLAVVQLVKVLNPAAAQTYALVTPTAQASGGIETTGLVMDARSVSLRSNVLFSTGAPLAAVPPPIIDEESADTAVGADTLKFTQPFVLGPGQRASLYCATLNTAVKALWFGYERKARPEELSGL